MQSIYVGGFDVEFTEDFFQLIHTLGHDDGVTIPTLRKSLQGQLGGCERWVQENDSLRSVRDHHREMGTVLMDNQRHGQLLASLEPEFNSDNSETECLETFH